MTMLTDAIVQRLTHAILNRRVPPGAKLNERDLASAFDTSRTVIRQALIRLEENMLVNIEPHRGAFVVKPTLEEAHQLSQAQILIEKAVVEAVIAVATPEQLAQLRAHTALERDADLRGDHALADELGVEFHTMLSGMLKNPPLQKIHSDLMARQRVVSAVFKTDFDYCQLRGEHDALIAAIEARALKKAQRIVEAHYRLLIKGHVSTEGEKVEVDWGDVLRQEGAGIGAGSHSSPVTGPS